METNELNGVAQPTTAQLVADYETALAELTSVGERAKELAARCNALKSEIASRLGLYPARTNASRNGRTKLWMADDTARQWLRDFAPHAPIKVMAFSDLMQVSTSRVSVAMSTLKRKGLVAGDPITHLWTLTPQGRAFLNGEGSRDAKETADAR